VGLSALIFTRAPSSNDLDSSLRLEQLFLRLGKEKRQPSFVHNHRELPFRHTLWPLQVKGSSQYLANHFYSTKYRIPESHHTRYLRALSHGQREALAAATQPAHSLQNDALRVLGLQRGPILRPPRR
jgi:hypothetical protein